MPPGEKAASSTAQPQPGPTLTLLFDDSSPFKGRVEDYEGVQVVCTPAGTILTAYRNRDFRGLRPALGRGRARPIRSPRRPRDT